MYSLPGLPDLTLTHEACHAVVARHLGLDVMALTTDANRNGMCLIGHGSEPQDLFNAAIATAAAVVFDRWAGQDEAFHEDDVVRVYELQKRYEDATGATMPDPHEAAAAILRRADVTQRIMRLANAMRIDEAYSGEQLAAMADGMQMVQSQSVDIGVGVGIGIGGKGGGKPLARQEWETC